MKTTTRLIVFLLIGSTHNSIAQCANPQNVFAFTYGGKNYEIIKENKTWMEAAACAVTRGGYLAEVNNAAENEAIFNQLALAGVNPDDTEASDGFSSYIWLGGNDISSEGNWIWDGDGDAAGIPFWQGTANGTPINDRYNNWGNEPDNFGGGVGQDGLGMAVESFPNGEAGEWNDVNHNNALFFVVEFNAVLGIDNARLQKNVTLYPNPESSVITISAHAAIRTVTIYTMAGQEVNVIDGTTLSNGEVPVAQLPAGLYIIKINLDDNTTVTKKLTKV